MTVTADTVYELPKASMTVMVGNIGTAPDNMKRKRSAD
jgi:hypothetical protein